jgi:hypothetical protein
MMNRIEIGKPGTPAERVELANRLFKEFYTACFWHMKPDLKVTEALIPAIVKGLRTYGGRRGMLAAAELTEQNAGKAAGPPPAS